MRTTAKLLSLSVACALSFANSRTWAQDASMPPLMKQINNGNWLDPKQAESFRDELFYQRACQAYMSMLPALHVLGPEPPRRISRKVISM